MRRFLPLVIGLLALASGALAWWRLAPYDPDARGASYQVISVRVTRDYQFCWLDVALRTPAGHAAPQPILLAGGSGWRLAPAAITPAADHLELRFWLEDHQLGDPLELEIGTNRLRIKPAGRAPELDNGQSRNFRSLAW